MKLYGIHYYAQPNFASNGVAEVGISFLATSPITPSAFTFTLHNLQYERDIVPPGDNEIIHVESIVLIPGDWVFHVA